jgi:hypothetical protein
MHVCKAHCPACGLQGKLDSVEILPASGYPGLQSTCIMFDLVSLLLEERNHLCRSMWWVKSVVH